MVVIILLCSNEFFLTKYKTKEAAKVPEIKCISTINFFMKSPPFFARLRSLNISISICLFSYDIHRKSKHISMFEWEAYLCGYLSLDGLS